MTTLPDIEPAPSDDPFAGMQLEDDDTPEPPAGKRTRQRRAPRVRTEDGEDVPRTRQPRNAQLQDDLLEAYVEFASGIGVAVPTVSGVLIVRAEKTVDGVISLASGHKRTMAALRKVAKVSKGGDVVQTLVLVMVAGMLDMGRIPLDHPILDNMGHVEIERDESGKPRRDSKGKYIKTKVSLRDIHHRMNETDSSSSSTSDHEYMAPVYTMPTPPTYRGGHETGTAPITVPPMNWSPNERFPG